ncbi:MAG: MMPL family transporter [Chloroflexota bacterium]
MFAKMGHAIYRRRWLTLILGLVFMVVSGVIGTTVFGSLKTGGYNNPNAESTRVTQTLKDELGRDDRTLIVLFTSKDGTTVENPAYKSAVEGTLAKIDGQPDVGAITTYYMTGASQLVSNNKQSTYAVVGLDGDDDSQLATMKVLRPLLKSDNLLVRLGGYAAVSQDMTNQVQKDLEHAETLSFPIVFILLLVIFGSLLAAALPLFIGGFAILGAFLILRITANFTDVSVFSVNIITMLGLGLAIDYSLFVVSRFREELVRRDGDVQAALVRTMQTAGRTVFFSGLTVTISLLSLMVFPPMFMRSMGWGGSAAVVIAMIAAITVLPAALALLGPRVNSLSVWSLFGRNRGKAGRNAGSNEQTSQGYWYKASTFVMRRPVMVLLVTVIPLMLVGLPFFRINLTIPDQRSLPESAESRQVGDVLTNEFPHNETTPIQVVVKSDKAALDPQSLSALFNYTRQLAEVPGVRRVDSLVNLDPRLDAGGATAYTMFYSAIGNAQNPQGAPAAQAAKQFSNGNYSAVNVLFDSDPTSREAETLVNNIRAVPAPDGLSTLVGGRSAEQVDFLAGLLSSIPLALVLIIGVMFLLLFVMLGSVVVPIKAVLLNILSLSASFGALVWIFQDGNLTNLLGFTSLGSVDGTLPVLIFALAFGLSMDYEVFLLSRIKENYDRTKDTPTAVALGVQKTGGIITSAALLLVVVIGAFAMSEVQIIKQIGIGLALAILVDATVVRTLLVPATMRLLGKYNWWAPRPLAALYDRLGMAERDEDGDEGSAAEAQSATEENRAAGVPREKAGART